MVNPIAPLIVAPVVDALPETPVTAPLLTAITLLPTAPEVAAALVQLVPGTINLASPRVAYRATQRFRDAWASQLEGMQEACVGDKENDARTLRRFRDDANCRARAKRAYWWISEFGDLGRQNNVNGFEGYDSQIVGAMIAYDTPLVSDLRGGAGFRYARSELDANLADSKGNINSYQGLVYLDYAPGLWFANAAFLYGFDDYWGSRRVVFPGVDSTLSANYSGHQVGVYGSAGYRFRVGDGQTVITPIATLEYTNLHVDSYGETGDPALNLNVRSQNYNFAEAGVGGRISRNMALSNTQILRSELHVRMQYSLNDNTTAETAAFAGGGPSFTTAGRKAERYLYDVGAGVTLAGNRRWTLEGIYDYQWQNSFTAHQARVNFVLHI